MFGFTFLIFPIYVFGLVPLKNRSQIEVSQVYPSNLSISNENWDKLFKNRLENVCSSYMNTNYKIKNSWECFLIYSLPFEKKVMKLLDPDNKKQQIDCICSLSYDCYDYEEFVLETGLVNAKDYMSKEYFLGKNIYTQQCEHGLAQLTDETNWNCVLQYDRFGTEEEYYCNCKRPTICRIEKKLSI